jgi:hypothetical protein
VSWVLAHLPSYAPLNLTAHPLPPPLIFPLQRLSQQLHEVQVLRREVHSAVIRLHQDSYLEDNDAQGPSASLAEAQRSGCHRGFQEEMMTFLLAGVSCMA